MRRRTVLTAGSALLALPAALPAAEGAEALPVVLELFTSQGCSSCPPADALLGELARRPGVVALAWHVDYWNNLGWRDPYARPDWTQRQRRYAELLNDEVYTPALVVNGARMIVGSDRSAVQASLNEPHLLSVDVGLKRSAKGLVARIGSRPDAAVLSLIVYDATHATSVKAGENSGRTLRETHVVRSQTVFPYGDRDVSQPLQDIAPEQGAILLVQGSDWAVLGVAEVKPATADQP